MRRLLPKMIRGVPFLMLAACAEPSVRVEPSGPPIAVLLFDNQSNDVTAGEKVRAALHRTMADRGWNVIPLPQVDASLQHLGITDGGQLRAYSAETVAGGTGGYRLVYGEVQEFGVKSAVALTQRKVALKVRLVDGNDGKTLFEKTGVGIDSKAGVDAAGDLALNVAGKVAKSLKGGVKALTPGEAGKKAVDATDAIADVDLTQQTDEAVRQVLETFPR